MGRWKPTAGHVMLELLYGNGVHLQRNGAEVHVYITKACKELCMRPVRLIECIMWLRDQMLLSDVTVGRYEIKLRIKVPEGLCDTKPIENTHNVVPVQNANKQWWNPVRQ